MRKLFIFIFIIAFSMFYNGMGDPLYSTYQDNQFMTDLLSKKLSEIDNPYTRNIKERHYMRQIEDGNVSSIYLDEDYYFYKDIMPREYLEVFLLSTKDRKEKRILIYSMMLVESGNFTKYINTNKNGTIDHGPLMLNSSNIKSESFRNKFFPDDEFLNSLKESNLEDIYIKYIPACVNLMSAHLIDYNGDLLKSLRAYNGGPRANNKNAAYSLRLKTYRYYKKVLKNIKAIEKEYNEFVKLEIDPKTEYLKNL